MFDDTVAVCLLYWMSPCRLARLVNAQRIYTGRLPRTGSARPVLLKE
jgi:hypothetical protein